MKILVVTESIENLAISLADLENLNTQNNGLYQYKFNHIEIDLLLCGHTLFETAYFLGSTLAKNKYHLILSLSTCGSVSEEYEIGKIVNIINDKPAFFGEQTQEDFKSVYALKQLNPFEFPHQRGALINMTNAYFNVFLPFQKAPAITTTILKGNQQQIEQKQEQFPLNIETQNGLGIHYSCLHQQTNFYRISAISYNLATKSEDFSLAIENLNLTFLDILNKL